MTAAAKNIDLAVVGSVAIDTIATPVARRERIMGGSVSYACAAASFFSVVGMVGIVGEDCSREYRSVFEHFGIDTCGLLTAAGKTFHWSGVYEADMNRRRTLATELNVFEHFSPQLPHAYQKAPFLLLANIAPQLQHLVLEQVASPLFVAADTMDLWIHSERDSLRSLLPRIDLLLLNDEEARLLAGQADLVKAAGTIQEWGADYVLIKKGEHGAMLAGKNEFLLLPAFPLTRIQDPTGAGDCFAGAFMGRLAGHGKQPDENTFRDALVHAAVVSAFCVEDFGMERLHPLTNGEIKSRIEEFRRMIV